MKGIANLLAVLLIGIATGKSASAQAYEPMLRYDRIWEVIYSNSDASSHYYYSFEQHRDTLVNGHVYSSPTASAHYFLREDSAAKQVFITDTSFNEVLFYDFNAQVGDTFFISVPNPDFVFNDTLVAIARDSIEIAGTQRTRIELLRSFGYCWSLYWIEGIGSSLGPIWNFGDDCMWNTIDLACYRDKNDSTLTPIYGWLCSPVAVSQPAPEEIEVRVWPNPATEMVTISASAPVEEIYLYSMDGKRFSLPFIRESEQVVLNLKAMPPGLFVLSAHTRNGTLSKRIQLVR